MRDLMNNIATIAAIAPLVVSDGTVAKSIVIDVSGYDSLTFVIQTGLLADTDATWAVTVKDGATDTQTEHVAVDDVFLIGSEALAGFTFADDGATRKIGYKGGQRYVSIEIDDVVANLGSAPLAVLAILGHPKTAPTANPPA